MNAATRVPPTSFSLTSADGTRIAGTRRGGGPAVVLVDGAFDRRSFSPNTPLAPLLADAFTVLTYDRRGRGDSGDTQPYAVRREVEDLAAVVQAAGGSAYVYGLSSGAAIALEAAATGVPITRLAVYEPPYVVDDSRAPNPPGWEPRLTHLVAARRRGAAVRYFLRTGAGLPRAAVALANVQPAWWAMRKVAHTLPYEAAIVGDLGFGRPLPPDRWARVAVPTLVMSGEHSPGWLRSTADQLVAVLGARTAARLHRLEGQTHIPTPTAAADVLREFFSGPAALG